MIIELFGPPASGKTTLAQAVCDSFAAAGAAVVLVSSARPAEKLMARADSGRALRIGAKVAAPLMRLTKIAGAVPAMLSANDADCLTSVLLKHLPPIGMTTKVRSRRYLSRLELDWKKAADAPCITVFDQGYMSAVASLLHHGRIDDRAKIAEVLELVPKPDLLVCLDAPRDILQRRLEKRLGGQNRLERLFELGLENNLQQRDIITALIASLKHRPSPLVEVSSVDGAMLEEALQLIAQQAAQLERAGGSLRAA